jgi:lipopolysaccharide export system permease protein
MKLSILSRYCFQNLQKWFLKLAGIFSGMSGLFELIEQVRRIRVSHLRVTHGDLIQLVILKIPSLLVCFFPYVIFITSSLFLWELKKNRELLTIFSAGFSPLGLIRCIAPFLLSVWGFYGLILQPISSIFLQSSNQLESKLASQAPSGFWINSTGIWLQDYQHHSYFLIHFKKFNLLSGRLEDVEFHQFSKLGVPVASYKAQMAFFSPHQWQLHRGQFWIDQEHKFFKNLSLSTSLSSLQSLEPIYQPQQIPIYRMFAFMNQLKEHGFSTTAYQAYLHKLGDQSLYFTALLMVAMILVLLHHHSTSFLLVNLIGFIIGLHFIDELIQALMIAGRIPIWVGSHLISLILIAFGWIFLRSHAHMRMA